MLAPGAVERDGGLGETPAPGLSTGSEDGPGLDSDLA